MFCRLTAVIPMSVIRCTRLSTIVVDIVPTVIRRAPSHHHAHLYRSHSTTARLAPLANRHSLSDIETHLTHDRPVRIGVSPGAGLGLFATRDISEGDIIWEERPLIIHKVDQQQLPERNDALEEAELDEQLCHHCLGPIKPLQIVRHRKNSSNVEPHPSGERIWNDVIANMSSIEAIGLDPNRAPITPPVECRTTAHGEHPPCQVRYCSSQCEHNGWIMNHEREHLSPAEVTSLTPHMEHINTIIHDHTQREEVILMLLRVLSMLRSDSATKKDSRGLTLLDHLAHLSTSLDTPMFDESHLHLFDTAMRPFLSNVIARHNLQVQLDSFMADTSLSPEQKLLRGLLGAFSTNTFQLIKSVSLLAHEDCAGHLSLEPFYPRFDLDEPGRYTFYATIFSLASFMNHSSNHNVAFLIDSSSNGDARIMPLGYEPAPIRFAALKPIKQGEELFWMYSREPEVLRDRYGIH